MLLTLVFQITLVYFIQKRKNSRELIGQLEKKNKLVVLKSFEPKLSKLKLISYHTRCLSNKRQIFHSTLTIHQGFTTVRHVVILRGVLGVSA